MNRKCPILNLILFWALSFPVIAFANSPTLNYHPFLNHVPIPGSFDLKHDTVRVNAPVGEFIQSPILHVRINGKGPFLFMFDTGFTRSIVSRRVVEALKLPQVKTSKFQVITPNQVVDVFEGEFYIKSLQLGDLTLNDFSLFATSGFEDEVDLFKEVRGKGLDGVIGANAIYGLLTTIDYQKEHIEFAKKQLDPQNPKVLTFAKKGITPSIHGRINFTRLNKEVYQRFLLDTGSYSYIFINACNIPEMMKFVGRENILTYDYLGSSTTTYFAKLFGQVKVVPGYTIESPYITFSPRLCNTDTSGDLGRKFFEHHRVTINNKQQLVKIERF